MVKDWEITHELNDMPPELWQFIKDKGFLGMIIPKSYGGLEFSAYAHSCVLVKLASRSATSSSTGAVPNSLKSPPVQKAGPLPRKSMTRTSGSAAARSSDEK